MQRANQAWHRCVIRESQVSRERHSPTYSLLSHRLRCPRAERTGFRSHYVGPEMRGLN
jgi:hypothetical protein